MPGMELRQLRYFFAIVDAQGLSRAAKQLHVAQSALSRQVADLEAELGVPLLVRSRTGVAVTAGTVPRKHVGVNNFKYSTFAADIFLSKLAKNQPINRTYLLQFSK